MLTAMAIAYGAGANFSMVFHFIKTTHTHTNIWTYCSQVMCRYIVVQNGPWIRKASLNTLNWMDSAEQVFMHEKKKNHEIM